ncbi:hypothetical protein [Parasitella parasitica]|uniref:Plasma membrane fusion protein PRM1 n=1 Tax=Parasitella parasitica TaxID=35722 RepID=A0A0B7MUB2_9FUNG|nr:hypothetical protein [Parasitella parasitica]
MIRTLNENYSLAWLQMSTISLFTLIGSLLTVLHFISTHVNASRSRIETVCESINTKSEQIFNAPQILLQASVNSVFTAKDNIHRSLSTAIDVFENILVWLISMYKSTFRCLLSLAVHSVLSIVMLITKPLQKVAEGVTSILHLDDGSGQAMDWTQSLNKTQMQIDEWFKNDDAIVRQWIDKPFSKLQGQLNSTFDSWHPPALNLAHTNSSQPCQPDPLMTAIDVVEHGLKFFVYIVIGVLVGLILVCTIVNVVAIRVRHRQIARARSIYLAFDEKPHDKREEMDRYVWTLSSTMLSWQKRKNKVHQLLHFMSHPMVVYCLVVGTAGLIMTYGLAWLVETKSHALFDEFANKTEEWAKNATAQWTGAVTHQFENINTWIGQAESDLNEHAFGVIRSSAIAVNDTLGIVVKEIHNLIQSALGGTPLEQPAQEVIQCLLLNKIESIEQGLTWIAGHSNVHLSRVDVPQFDSIIMGPAMQASIHEHINLNDSSFVLA